MKTLYFALGGLVLSALCAIALGLGDFNARWLWEARSRYQDAHLITWLEYAQMWDAHFWRALLNPVRHVIAALPIAAILLLHRWPPAQAGVLVVLLAFLANDVWNVLALEATTGSRCRACDLSLLYHGLFGVAAIGIGLLSQACYWAWRLGQLRLLDLRKPSLAPLERRLLG